MEVLILDDDDAFRSIDPKRFLIEADRTVYLTGWEIEALRDIRIRGRDFEIHNDIWWPIEDGPVQCLRFRRISRRRHRGSLLQSRYLSLTLRGRRVERDAMHTDGSILERKRDRLIALAKKHRVNEMSIMRDAGSKEEARGAFGSSVGGRAMIQYRSRGGLSTYGFHMEATDMLGVNAIVVNMSLVKNPLEGEMFYRDDPDPLPDDEDQQDHAGTCQEGSELQDGIDLMRREQQGDP